jgi:hypothetical protein
MSGLLPQEVRMGEQVKPDGMTMFHNPVVTIPEAEYEQLKAIKERAEGLATSMSVNSEDCKTKRRLGHYVLTGDLTYDEC